MGFDVYGISPKENTVKPELLEKDYTELNDKEMEKYFELKEKWETENPGIYFRNNVWFWRPLWSYVCAVCEDVMTNEEQLAGTDNSGNEVSESTVERMVEKLVIEIALENHIKHEKEYKKQISELPKEECNTCEGTGKRREAPEVGAGDIKCNGCDGKGEKESWATHYPFSAENVEAFVNFLSESGGIQVY